MGKYFGTDGFRGRFGESITIEHALKIGEFLGFYYGGKNVEGIIIGVDTRESSPFLKTAVTMGINSFGVDVYDLDVEPTPGVAYLAKIYEMPGVVISASHNPYWDNGIKLFNEKGEKMDDGIIHALEVFMDSKDMPASEKEKGNIIPFSTGKKAYIDFLVSHAFDYTGLNIIIDLANGSSSKLAKEVFEKLNAKVTFINDEPDGKNINNGCGSTHMEQLSERVKEGSFDIGFAYDGDADRCLSTDDKGHILTGDHLLYLVSKYLKKKNNLKNNTVVSTVMSNYGLYEALDKQGINYIRCDVGDKNVYLTLKQNHLSFGGEESGHIIFLSDSSTGDGILTSIKILNILVEEKKKISELISDITIYPQVLKNVITNNKKEILDNPDIQKVIKNEELKLEGKGRILVRPSGTEPKIRVMAEASTTIEAEAAVKNIADRIEEVENITKTK